jgi:hypothetical protein
MIFSMSNVTFPVIVCIAKQEKDYIDEFIRYHLGLGFKRIYLYDNEDVPTYRDLLDKYKSNVTVIHYPFNNYEKGVQYKVLDHFTGHMMSDIDITHVAHIDIDEFIVLKKHKNISDFIDQYIVGDCQAIGMNWRFFGSSGFTEKENIPVTTRFTMCENAGNIHIKTLFKKESYLSYQTCHSISLKNGYTKSTNGTIILGPFNHSIDFDVIQLNHYKCKTLPEFREIRKRQRADITGDINEDVDKIFVEYDLNEVEDLTARDFYISVLNA